MLVTCSALPEVTTFGSDYDDARSKAVDAIEEALAARIARGDAVPHFDGEPTEPEGRGKVPAPTDVALVPALTAAKVGLYTGLQEAGLTRAELARRLAWNRESVDRLFRLDHGSRLDQIELCGSGSPYIERTGETR